MPILGSIGGGSAGGFGQRKGGKGPYDIDFLVVAGGGSGGGEIGGEVEQVVIELQLKQ